MKTDLLNTYQNELTILRQNLMRFARDNPHLAKFISGNGDEISDPQINQLLEGIAFLNSRTHVQLEDSFSVFSNALLDLLCPDYLFPLPSMSILQLIPQASLQQAITLPAGLALETDPMSGYNCMFKTCYEIELLPAMATNFLNTPKQLGISGDRYAANAGIQISCLDAKQTFAALKPKKLRIYLSGERNIIETLYQYLLEHVEAVSICSADNLTQRWEFNSAIIKAVGFNEKETVLPAKADNHLRLLTEYFCFANKFWFIDIEIPNIDLWEQMADKIILAWHFNKNLPTHIDHLSHENFQLNAAPIINLFTQTAQAIQINQQQIEYPVIVNDQLRDEVTIYQIDQVLEQDATNHLRPIPKFYSIDSQRGQADKLWWATRELNSENNAEYNLAIIDRHAQPIYEETKISVVTTCCNGNLPYKLAVNHQLPALKFIKSPAPIAQYKLLAMPTPMHYLTQKRNNQWQFVAHVMLKQIDLANAEAIENWLNSIFELYNIAANTHTTALKNLIKSISSKQTVARLPHLTHNQFCYGASINLEIKNDDAQTPYYLFTKILDQCLVEYSQLNGFNQLKVSNELGVIKSWPIRSKTSLLR